MSNDCMGGDVVTVATAVVELVVVIEILVPTGALFVVIDMVAGVAVVIMTSTVVTFPELV